MLGYPKFIASKNDWIVSIKIIPIDYYLKIGECIQLDYSTHI